MRTQILAIVVAIAAVFLLGIPSFQKTSQFRNSKIAVLETSMGNITLEFFPNAAPKHVENFKTLARKGFYDGVEISPCNQRIYDSGW